MQDSVKVSVCCITYNHKPYLRQCIEGLLMQKTTFPFEILIHDDASTDGTTDIVKAYAEKYPNLIRPIIQSVNQYSTKTRALITTFLLPVAKGEYIALCEGDDYWTDPYKLQKQADILDHRADISLCLHPAVTIGEDGKRKIRKGYASSRIVNESDIIRWKAYYWMTASFMYRKSLMKNYPHFCLNCYVGDISLIYYMLTKGNIYYWNEVMSVYRKGVPGSHTKRSECLDYESLQLKLQTQIDMIDGINAMSNFKYNTYFVEKKVRLQLIVQKKKGKYDKAVVYNEFHDDLKQIAFHRRFKFLAKIYIRPYLIPYKVKTV